MSEIAKDLNIAFYSKLKHYKPVCYSGKGVPFLLVHDTYNIPLPCLLFIDCIFILAIVMFIITPLKPAN
jgi:hypothetical protein